MRTRDRADAIERVCDVGDPVAQCVVHRVLQRARAGLHGHDLSAQHLHADHVRLLPLDIDRAHVDDALKPEPRAQCRGGNAVLARAGLCDDSLLAHAPRDHDLAEHIVYLVRAGVVELLALQIYFLAAVMFGVPLGKLQRRRTADVILQIAVHLFLKRRIGLGLRGGLLQIEDQRHQRFGDEAAAEGAEMAALVRAGTEGIGFRKTHDCPWSWPDLFRPSMSCFHISEVAGLVSASRAAAMNARISPASLTPSARSTPEETSTPCGRVMRMACARLPALSPPDSMNGVLRLRFSSTCQSNGTPSPPGRVASFGAWASNRMRSATAA